MALCCLVASPKDIIGNKQTKNRATNPPIEPLGLCYHAYKILIVFTVVSTLFSHQQSHPSSK